MGTIPGRQIVDKAVSVLTDDGHVRWSLSELLGWLNSGIVEILTIKPNAFTFNGPMPLVAGTKQTLPAGAVALVNVSRNMGADGFTVGRAITFISKKVLDQSYPGWHQAISSDTAVFFATDERDPKVFYVSPPSTGRNQAEVIYHALPTPLADGNADPDTATVNALAKPIPLDDIYENALVDYILYRAETKDLEGTGADSRASAFYTVFVNTVNGKDKVEIQNSPQAANEIKKG